MKLRNILYAFALSAGLTACTDTVQLGNAFLEKAPGGSVTADTIFGQAKYTRQYLASIYSRQYIGLTVGAKSGVLANNLSGWTGKMDALSDCWQLHYQSAMPYNYYYSGTLTAKDSPMFSFDKEFVWEVVRWSYLILENIDKVPDMEEAEKERIKGECYCLIATRYFDAFQNFGGLPLVKGSFSASESGINAPRATAEETVNFMVELLDKAIANDQLPWVYSGDDASTETGHWTKAGAMALKCRILAFAASPLFNSNEGYYGGSSEAEQQHLVWYGSYKEEYWQKLKTACDEFFAANQANGEPYKLVEATANGTNGAIRPEDYRLAYRKAYFLQDSPEVLHSVRMEGTKLVDAEFNWFYWLRIGRNAYNPTQEYVEMFPWADGTAFNWEKDSIAGKLDKMFLTGDTASNKKGTLVNVQLTRDPRLYESCVVNGLPKNLDWTTGDMSGDVFECWVSGYDAKQYSATEAGNAFATGYFIMKYGLGTCGTNSSGTGKIAPNAVGHRYQWVTLRLSDLYLLRAEANLQLGNYDAAISDIDKIRGRVGLKGLVASNPDKNYHNKQTLLDELLDERARELGFENSRWYDIVRYKMVDKLEKPLHGLLIHRLKLSNGEWVNDDTQFYGANAKKAPQPTHFSYTKFQLKNRARVWWNGFDKKWLLQPITQTEINKGYGLVQNPGW